MEKNNSVVFVGPSLGMSILGCAVLLLLKLTNTLNIGWIWVLCPLWIGVVVCFVLWLWFMTWHVVIKTLFKPIVVFIPLPTYGVEAEDECEDHEKDEVSDGM